MIKITNALIFKLCQKNGFYGQPQAFIFKQYSEIKDNNIVNVQYGENKGRCNETYQKTFRYLSDKLESVFGNISAFMICIICIFLNLQKHEKEGIETIHDVLESSRISDNNLLIDIGELLTKYKKELYRSAKIFFDNKNNGLTDSLETDTYYIISFIDDMISLINAKNDYQNIHLHYTPNHNI